MKAFLYASVLAVLAGSSAFSLDRTLLALAPADAKMVAGIYADRTRNTPFGQFVLGQMKEEDPNFKSFIGATGFDPRRDLTEILIVSNTTGPRSNRGLVLARGVFNGPQIVAAGKANGGSSVLYKGLELLTKPGTDERAVAVIDGSIAIAGDLASVKAAIDQRTAPANLDGRLLAKIDQASGQYDAWFAALGFAAPLGSALPMPNILGGVRNNTLQAIEQTSGGVKFGNIVQFSGEAVARSEKDAQALADVTRFLTGLVGMNKDQHPEMARLAALAQSLEVQATGNTVRLGLSLPQTDLEQLFRPKETRQLRRSARSTAGANAPAAR